MISKHNLHLKNQFLRPDNIFVVAPKKPGAEVKVKVKAPLYLTLNRAEPGNLAYADDLMEFTALPEKLAGKPSFKRSVGIEITPA